jgi:hypothetical protein
MGGSPSKSIGALDERIHAIVNGILDEKNNIKAKDYISMRDGVCSNVMMLMADDLRRFSTKDKLVDLGEEMYIIPKDYVAKNKQDICDQIKKYYSRIVDLILTAKVALNFDKTSINFPGLLTNNVARNRELLELAYCPTPQRDLDNHENERRVDFGKLEALTWFSERLNDAEYKAFIQNMQTLLNNPGGSHMVCSSPGLSNAHTSAITGGRSISRDQKVCGPRTTTGRSQKDLMWKVGENNPVIAPGMCDVPKKFQVPMSDPKVAAAFERFVQNYVKGLQAVEKVLLCVVSYDRGTGLYELKNPSLAQLDKYESQMRTLVITIHMQSLADFQKLIKEALLSESRSRSSLPSR